MNPLPVPLNWPTEEAMARTIADIVNSVVRYEILLPLRDADQVNRVPILVLRDELKALCEASS